MPMTSFLTLAPEEHVPHRPNVPGQHEAERGMRATAEDATPPPGFLTLVPETSAPWHADKPAMKKGVEHGSESAAQAKEGKYVPRFAKLRRAFSLKRG